MAKLDITSWFSRGAGDRKPADNPMKALASSLTDWGNGIFAFKGHAVDLVAALALENPVVYRCVDKIGLAVQAVNWYAEGDPDVAGKAARRSIYDLETVLKLPTDEMTGSQLRYWMAMNISLSGRVALKAGVGNGRLSGLYPLQQGKLKTVKGTYGNITGYNYGDQGKPTFINSFASVGKSESGYPNDSFAFAITKPSLNLLDDTGNDPLKAIKKQIKILNLLADRGLDTADESPNVKYILTLPVDVTDEQERAIKKQIDEFRVGEQNSGGIMTIYGVDVNVIKLENNLSDLHTKLPADDMSRHIAGVFGVPVALMGTAAADSSKFANNFAEARLSFYQDTIIPGYLIPIQESLTRYVAPKGIRIRFDIDSIPALQQARAALAKDLASVPFLTDDEKREVTGWPALKVSDNAPQAD